MVADKDHEIKNKKLGKNQKSNQRKNQNFVYKSNRIFSQVHDFQQSFKSNNDEELMTIEELDIFGNLIDQDQFAFFEPVPQVFKTNDL